MDWVEGLGIEWTGWKDWDRMDWAKKKIYIYTVYLNVYFFQLHNSYGELVDS